MLILNIASLIDEITELEYAFLSLTKSGVLMHPIERAYNQLQMIAADPMKPSAIHGMLCAVIVVPGMVPPSVWLKAVYNMKGAAPEFRSAEQRDIIVNGLVDYYQKLVSDISAEKVFPYSSDGEKPSDSEIRRWAEGFLFGFNSVGLPDDQKLREQYYAMLSPFLLWANPEMFGKSIEENSGKDPSAEKVTVEELKTRVYDNFPGALSGLFILSGHILRSRSGNQNPNDSCSCGSGKKYKNCCGKPKHKD